MVSRRISLASLAGKSGRGVRVAVVDTGVHASHPHVGGVDPGIAIDDAGQHHDDLVDRLGHGTAVAAAIREKAPAASIIPVKVFDRSLTTTGLALAEAIRWSVAAGAHLINLSLGTTNSDHRHVLAEVIEAASAAGSVVVTAAPDDAHEWLPGALLGVVAVEVDWTIDRDVCEVVAADSRGLRVRASGYPRPIPGVPPERNLKGVSFAVANATGLLALVMEGAEVRSPLAFIASYRV